MDECDGGWSRGSRQGSHEGGVSTGAAGMKASFGHLLVSAPTIGVIHIFIQQTFLLLMWPCVGQCWAPRDEPHPTPCPPLVEERDAAWGRHNNVLLPKMSPSYSPGPEYVTLQCKNVFVDVIKLRTLSCRFDPGLPRGLHVMTKVLMRGRQEGQIRGKVEGKKGI